MNRWIRRAAIGAGGLVGVLAVAYTAVHAATERRLGRSWSAVEARPLTAAHTPDVARGARLATTIGKCTDCHGADLGGRVFLDIPPGFIVASNLTGGRGGVLGRYTDAQLARAIRQGIRHDGLPLRVMPSDDWQRMSDQDAADLIAYLRSIPAVDRDPGTTQIRPLGRVLMAAGQLPVLAAERVDHAAVGRTAAPVAGPTKEYGSYLAGIGGCTGCHRPDLSGGHIPGTPPAFKDATNLTPAGPLARWSEADFARALRTGRRPDGTQLDSLMPWPATAGMSDEEIRALWLYIRSVPARTTGES